MPETLIQITLYTDKDTEAVLGRVSTVRFGPDEFETLVTRTTPDDALDIAIHYASREQAEDGHKIIISVLQWVFPDTDIHHFYGRHPDV